MVSLEKKRGGLICWEKIWKHLLYTIRLVRMHSKRVKFLEKVFPHLPAGALILLACRNLHQMFGVLSF